jgi:24-methylenesterol C-methyltransferase
MLTVLWITPKGVVEVHEMLFETTQHLTLGGETGIFTPMHMVLLRKPAAF